MIYKLFGVTMIFVSSTITANTLISYEKKKIKQIDSFIALIKYIRNQIECYSMPIDRILFSCPDELVAGIGSTAEKGSFEKLISGCDVICGDDCRRILEEFARSLGKNYRDRQIKLCDTTVSELESVRAGLQRIYPSKKKTITALCLATGGLAVIALI